MPLRFPVEIMNKPSLLISLIFSALLAACASQPENVVLLPGPDGQTGSLQVIAKDQPPLVLDKAYQSADVGRSHSEVTQLDSQAARARFADALAVQPPPPQRFIIYFREGSDELTQTSQREFADIPREIALRPTPDVVVIGHTDTVGKMEDNDLLARRRAEKMREILIKAGVAAENIQATGRGERELLVKTPDETDEPRNRRVEILVR